MPISELMLQNVFPFTDGRAGKPVEIGIDHNMNQVFESDPRPPAKRFVSFSAICQKEIHFGWAHVLGIDFDVLLPVQAGVFERLGRKLLVSKPALDRFLADPSGGSR